MAERYCVGMTMAVDWGEEESQGVDRRLVRRVLCYFRSYWRLSHKSAQTSTPKSPASTNAI